MAAPRHRLEAPVPRVHPRVGARLAPEAATRFVPAPEPRVRPGAEPYPEPPPSVRPEAELYPAFVKLSGRRCLVVGGGPVGFQKTLELLRCGAVVHVVAIRWTANFTPLDGRTQLSRSTRPFDPVDLEGVFLAVAATNDDATQEAVWRGAEERKILCNVVDVPERCNFYVPASLRRGSLTVSVSTDGKSPLFAVALRDRLAARLGPALGPGLERLGEARRLVRALHPADPARRRFALGRLLTPEAIDQLLEGRLEEFEAHWRSWKSSLSD